MDHQNSLAKWNLEETESGQARRGPSSLPNPQPHCIYCCLLVSSSSMPLHSHVNLDCTWNFFFTHSVLIWTLNLFTTAFPYTLAIHSNTLGLILHQDTVQVLCRNKPDSLLLKCFCTVEVKWSLQTVCVLLFTEWDRRWSGGDKEVPYNYKW